MEWDNLHLKAGPVVDIQPSLDSNLLFSEKDVKAVVSALFDQYWEFLVARNHESAPQVVN